MNNMFEETAIVSVIDKIHKIIGDRIGSGYEKDRSRLMRYSKRFGKLIYRYIVNNGYASGLLRYTTRRGKRKEHIYFGMDEQGIQKYILYCDGEIYRSKKSSYSPSYDFLQVKTREHFIMAFECMLEWLQENTCVNADVAERRVMIDRLKTITNKW